MNPMLVEVGERGFGGENRNKRLKKGRLGRRKRQWVWVGWVVNKRIIKLVKNEHAQVGGESLVVVFRCQRQIGPCRDEEGVVVAGKETERSDKGRRCLFGSDGVLEQEIKSNEFFPRCVEKKRLKKTWYRRWQAKGMRLPWRRNNRGN